MLPWDLLTRQNYRSSITVGDTVTNVKSVFDLESSALEDEILTLRSEPDQHLLKLDNMQWSGNYGGGEASQSQKNTLNLTALFGSTYLCKSAFSHLKMIKTRYKLAETDSHLAACLRHATGGYTLGYEKLAASSQCQVFL